MTKIVICRNSFDLSECETFEAAEVGSFLYGYFRNWPPTAKLFQTSVDPKNEIAIKTAEDVYSLNSLKGTVYVVIYPAGMIFASVLLIGATIAIQVWSKKKKSQGDKQANKRKEPQGSPNNSLSDRSNQARVNQRIPDIYGTVRSIPDMLVPSYRFYVDNKEYEASYLCIGRGGYEINDVKDDKTDATNVSNLNYEFYKPYDSPNEGTPQLSRGNIDEPFISAVQSSAVSDVRLPPPNLLPTDPDFFQLSFAYFDALSLQTNGIDLRDKFANGDSITLNNTPVQIRRITSYSNNGFFYSVITSTVVATLDLSGTYTILSVEKSRIVLNNPGAVNSDWDTLDTYASDWWNIFVEPDATSYFVGSPNPTVILYQQDTASDPLKGPYLVDNCNGLLINFNAPQGLYADDGVDQVAVTVNLRVTYQRLNADDSFNGSPVVSEFTITGSATNRDEVGLTHRLTFAFTGRANVYVERYSDTDLDFEGQYQDEVFLKSLYGTTAITQNHFGDVTTVRVIANSKEGATSSGERKFNCLVSRLLLKYDGTAFQGRQVTSNFVDIVIAICIDPFIGNLELEDIDLENLWQTQLDIIDYFGTDKAVNFNHTFDDENLSFEEILSIVCEAVFVTAYRQGTVLKFFFEKETENSSILFNHRNKLPNSETRTVKFGYIDDKDGVDVQYSEANTGNPKKIFIPEDQSARNPESITLLGITDRLQAYFHAWRLWNRIRYQTTAIEFEATQEANLLNIGERILVADNIRTNTFDGEVVSQSGNTLTLSEAFEFDLEKSYVIFLQNRDGTVQSLGVTPGATPFEVVLSGSTNLPLALDLDLFARTTYEIVEFGSNRQRAFLVEEKTPKDGGIVGIKAVNYDERYYVNDKDYDNNIVDENGF